MALLRCLFRGSVKLTKIRKRNLEEFMGGPLDWLDGLVFRLTSSDPFVYLQLQSILLLLKGFNLVPYNGRRPR